MVAAVAEEVVRYCVANAAPPIATQTKPRVSSCKVVASAAREQFLLGSKLKVMVD